MNFTPEELAILTPLDAAAHDLARVEAAKSDTIVPCWLVTHDEARKEMRQKARKWLSNQGATDIELFNKQFSDDPVIQNWRHAEWASKQDRDMNNPHAFFCHSAPKNEQPL